MFYRLHLWINRHPVALLVTMLVILATADSVIESLYRLRHPGMVTIPTQPYGGTVESGDSYGNYHPCTKSAAGQFDCREDGTDTLHRK